VIGDGRDRLLGPRGSRRRRRRFPPFVPALLAISLAGGLVALWIWVFSPIFIEPHEWHARQKRFERVIRDVLRGRPGSGLAIPDLPTWPPKPTDDVVRLVTCAESQVIDGVRLSTAYHRVTYPWGDIPAHFGSTADLLVRCLREVGLDLQQLVHIDRTTLPRRYPTHLWAAKRPDRTVDHRRMPNLITFAKAYLDELPTDLSNAESAAAFHPGDIIFWAPGGSHGFPGMAGIVVDRRGPDGVPRAVTLVPRERVMSLHHRVNAWPVVARFRVVSDVVLQRFLETHPGAVLAPRPP